MPNGDRTGPLGRGSKRGNMQGVPNGVGTDLFSDNVLIAYKMIPSQFKKLTTIVENSDGDLIVTFEGKDTKTMEKVLESVAKVLKMKLSMDEDNDMFTVWILENKSK